MRNNEFNGRLVKVAGSRKVAELFVDEIREPQFSIRQPLDPLTKFGDILFLHRLTDLERRQFQVGVNNPGVVAIVV